MSDSVQIKRKTKHLGKKGVAGKCVVLLSGGLDSTIALHWALNNGEVLAAVTVNYNQRHWIEVACAARIARRAKVRHEIEQLGGRGVGLNAALTGTGAIESAAAAVVPMRNLMLLSICAAWAERLGADNIIAGFSQADAADFPDCRHGFVAAAANAISLSLDRRVRIIAPLINDRKAYTLKMAKELPGCWHALGMSWTCYTPERAGINTGHVKACGKCPSCVLRAKAFAEFGEADPAADKEFRG